MQDRQNFVPNILFTKLVKYLWIYLQKTWTAGRRRLKFGVLSNEIVLRKKLENKKILRAAVLCANISQIFFLNWIIKNICGFLFKSLFNWSSHFFTSFSKPAGIPTDSCENSAAAEMGFNSYPNIKQKWNWFQIFLSEIYESPKNGSRGVFFLISGFLQGLTHSAMAAVGTQIGKNLLEHCANWIDAQF